MNSTLKSDYHPSDTESYMNPDQTGIFPSKALGLAEPVIGRIPENNSEFKGVAIFRIRVGGQGYN